MIFEATARDVGTALAEHFSDVVHPEDQGWPRSNVPYRSSYNDASGPAVARRTTRP